MDQPTPDHLPPAAPPARDQLVETRLQTKLDGTTIVAWTRGWVSRETRAHRWLAARTFDFAVLTEHNLTLLSTGFFTRRPRRLVYSAPLADVRVVEADVPRGRRLSIRNGDEARRLRIELHAGPSADAFADALRARVPSRRE